MLISILISLMLLAFGTLAENYLAGGVIMNGRKIDINRSIEATEPHNWARIIAPAVSVGLVYYFTKVAPIWLVWVFFALIICVIFHYVAWYRAEADQPKELAMFIPLFIVPSLVLIKVGKILVGSIESPFWSSVVGIIPTLVLILVTGIILVMFLWNIKKIIAILLAIAVLTVSVNTVVQGVEWPKKAAVTSSSTSKKTGDKAKSKSADSTSKKTGDKAKSTEVVVESSYGWHFYNTDLQTDGSESNDFNFGPNPVKKGLTAADYDDDFRTRLSKDPALGAADMAWLDANVGTRFLGEFYETCKHDWSKTINAAKERWSKNPSEYFRTLAAFFGYLNKAKKAIVGKGNNITDQMYMNPYTTDGVPDVIVLKTKQQNGPFLVYTFTIKGNTFKVEYRIPCGYQPTNVKLVMGIKPQNKPSKGSGGSISATPSKTTKTKPVVTKPPTPTVPDKPVVTTKRYYKDPSLSNNSGKNDDKGPGENTNTGGNKSSKEKKSNSNNLSSYNEYRAKIKELQDANSGNGSNNTSNKPSTSGGSGVKVDNNADQANVPTPTTDKVSEINGDQNAQAWDGPAD